MPDFIFDGWSGLGRVALSAALAYLALVVFLRFSGKRTLTKLNAFDLVVTIALGSVLASVITSRSVPLAEGVFALFLLIFFQFLVTWAAVRFPAFIALGEARLAVRYRFEPGAPDDGMTVSVPLHLLNALDPARLSWLAPGFEVVLDLCHQAAEGLLDAIIARASAR